MLNDIKDIVPIWKDKKHFLAWPWSFTEYSLTNDRLFIKTGLLTQYSFETFLYRIIDVSVRKTLLNRMCGTGTIIISSRDVDTPIIEVKNVKAADKVKELIIKLVQETNNNKGVLEVF